MGALNLIPLVVLFLVVGGVGWVGYQVCPNYLGFNMCLPQASMLPTRSLHFHAHN